MPKLLPVDFWFLEGWKHAARIVECPDAIEVFRTWVRAIRVLNPAFAFHRGYLAGLDVAFGVREARALTEDVRWGGPDFS